MSAFPWACLARIHLNIMCRHNLCWIACSYRAAMSTGPGARHQASTIYRMASRAVSSRGVEAAQGRMNPVRSSRAERVAADLEEEILNGRLPVGAHLGRRSEIMDRFGIS